MEQSHKPSLQAALLQPPLTHPSTEYATEPRKPNCLVYYLTGYFQPLVLCTCFPFTWDALPLYFR